MLADEMAAMKAIARALAPLSEESKYRVLNFIAGSIQKEGQVTISLEASPHNPVEETK